MECDGAQVHQGGHHHGLSELTPRRPARIPEVEAFAGESVVIVVKPHPVPPVVIERGLVGGLGIFPGSKLVAIKITLGGDGCRESE